MTEIEHALKCDKPKALLGTDSDGYVWVSRYGCHVGHSWSEVDIRDVGRQVTAAEFTRKAPRPCQGCPEMILNPTMGNQRYHPECAPHKGRLGRSSRRCNYCRKACRARYCCEEHKVLAQIEHTIAARPCRKCNQMIDKPGASNQLYHTACRPQKGAGLTRRCGWCQKQISKRRYCNDECLFAAANDRKSREEPVAVQGKRLRSKFTRQDNHQIAMAGLGR